MQPKRSTIVFKILQWSAAAVLLGRAWQHLYWDAPYRTLLWDQEWMEGPVRWLLGVDWATYATSPATDLFVQWAVWGTGLFYLLGALSAAFIHKAGAAGRSVLYLSSISLLFLSTPCSSLHQPYWHGRLPAQHVWRRPRYVGRWLSVLP